MSLPFVNNFPTSANDAVSNSVPTNNASSTLTGAITATTLLIPVADIAEFDDQGCATIVDDLDNPTTVEIFDWTSKSGSNLVVPSTAERGQDGTTAASFSSGAYIEARPTRRHYSYTTDRLDAIETKLGTGSAIAVNKLAALTASRAIVSDGSGFVSASAVTATELGYVSGVTSAIQTQLDGKQAAFSSQTANQVFAGPTTGSPASPAFRALVAADIPDLSGTYQPLDSDLTAIAALGPSNDDIIQRKAGAWTNRTVAQFKTDLGLATIATSGSASDLGSGTVPLARLSGITTSELSATAGITNGQLAGSIALSKLSITGTPDGTKYLRDDGSWQAIPGGGDALTSNPLSQFASTTSLQLKGVISDETGSGALVFAISPVLTTPDLGTPSAATLTNATGLPIATGVSGLGSGVATFLATPSSANLAAAVTGETGTGALVFGTSPDFTTGATIGGVAIPTISSTHTLTNKTIVLADGSAGAPTLRFASDTSSLGWYRSAQGWTFSNVGTTTIALASEGIRLADVARISFANGNPASTGGDVAIVRLAAGGLRISNDSTGAGNLSLGTSAAAFGTSAAGVLSFTLSTEPGSAPTDTAQLYSKDVSAGDHRLYLRNEGVAGSPVLTQICTSTLTNKTISGASNTLSNIGNSSLTNSSVTIGSTSVSLGGTAATVAGLTLTSPTIAKLANLTSNGLVTTSGGDGTLGVTVPGTGVLTALAVNVGSAGAFVTFNGALGTPSSGVATNLTGTASGLTAGAATVLATARAIYGNNFDGSAALTQIIASTYGGTGNGFTKFSGPTTSEKTFTLPNASATILTDNAVVTVAQGGTGAATLTGLLQGNGTSAVTAITNSTTVGQVLRVTGANTYDWGALDLADPDAITGDLPYANLTPSGSASKLLGRGDSGAGDWQEITIGSGLTMTGTTLSASGGGGGATTALDNLASVNINASLIPQSGKDLGAAATAWREIYLYGGGTFGSHSIKLTSTPTGNRTITIPDATDTMAVLGTAQTFTAAQTFSNTIAQSSASATAFVSGASSANPSFRVDNSTSSQASGIVVTGKAAGTAPDIATIARAQTASAQAGAGLTITADAAIAGSSNAGAAAGGAITITSGAAARLTSGNANGGNINLVTGAGIGTGTAGQVVFPVGALAAPSIVFSGSTNTGFYDGGGFPAVVTGGTQRQIWTANGAGVSALFLSVANQDIFLQRAAASTMRLAANSGGSTAATLSTPALSPAQITADQNNYAPGTGWFQRWNSDASRNVTGLAAGVDGQIAEVWNVGSQNIVLQNENASSTAANRFTTSTGADLTLAANKCALLRYDGTSARWRVRLGN